MSKQSFKEVVKKAAKLKAFEWLISEKDKLSKVKNVIFNELKMQTFLCPNNLEINQQKLLFQLRSRMTNLKENYKHKYKILLCPICQKDGDSQSHLLICEELNRGIQFISDQTILVEDIFCDNLDKQANATRLFETLLNLRTKLLENISVEDEIY